MLNQGACSLAGRGGLLTVSVLLVAAFLLDDWRLPTCLSLVGSKTEKASQNIPLNTAYNSSMSISPVVLPQACRTYVTESAGKKTLHLKHGRYIHIPGRLPPYDHNSCFLMKPRYNCATNNESSLFPKAYEWKFVLQSDGANESTLCDIHEIVRDFGGPAAFRDTTVGLFGDSLLRQVFEAIACTYQRDLTRALVNQDPPITTLAAMKERQGKPFSKSELGTIVSVPLDKRPIPHCSGNASAFPEFFRSEVSLTTPHLTDSCSDDLAMMEYNHSFQLYYNFHPERMQDTIQVYQELIGLNVSRLNAVFGQNGVSEYFESLGASIEATSFANFTSVIIFLKQRLKRDAGQWLGATNPWISADRDPIHPCMPGMPDDEAAVLLFSIIFDIHLFVVT